MKKVEANQEKIDLAFFSTEEKIPKKADEGLSEDELRILNAVRARQMLRGDDIMNIDSFGADSIDGLAPVMMRGILGLRRPTVENLMNVPTNNPEGDIFSKGVKMIDEQPSGPSEILGH